MRIRRQRCIAWACDVLTRDVYTLHFGRRDVGGQTEGIVTWRVSLCPDHLNQVRANQGDFWLTRSGIGRDAFPFDDDPDRPSLK